MLAYHMENYSTSRMAKFKFYVYELMGRPGNDELVQAMAQQFSGIVKGAVVASPDVPGAREFLREFSQQVPLYISSVTPQEELREIVQARGINSFFTEVYGNPPVQKVDAIRTVLSQQDLIPSQVIFIGDSASDYQAAVQTGLEFIGRDSGFGFQDAPVHLYKNLFEIGDEIRERMKG